MQSEQQNILRTRKQNPQDLQSEEQNRIIESLGREIQELKSMIDSQNIKPAQFEVLVTQLQLTKEKHKHHHHKDKHHCEDKYKKRHQKIQQKQNSIGK